MKTIQSYAVIAASCALLLCSGAQADTYTNSSGERVECNPETTTTQQNTGHPVAGTIAGAVIGGVAGHQLGKGHGKDAATAGGAVVGAGVGNHVSQGQTVTRSNTQENCRPVGGTTTTTTTTVQHN